MTEFTCEFVASAALSRIAQVDGRTPVATTRVGGGESVECTGIDHTPRARLSGEDSSDDVACGTGADGVHVKVEPLPNWLNNQVHHREREDKVLPWESPWQRGANENTNGLLCQHLPEGKDLSGYSQDDLNAIAWKLNIRPRKLHGFRTPLQVYAGLLEKAQTPDSAINPPTVALGT